MPITKHYAGQGCKCCAQSESECNCDVDWTDPEVYELRAKVVELENRLVIDTLNPNRREHIVQLTSRIDGLMNAATHVFSRRPFRPSIDTLAKKETYKKGFEDALAEVQCQIDKWAR